jgi:hypothetical protein
MVIKRKARRKQTLPRIVQLGGSSERQTVLYPIIGQGGKLEEFILLDRATPIPVHNPERDDVYLRAD